MRTRAGNRANYKDLCAYMPVGACRLGDPHPAVESAKLPDNPAAQSEALALISVSLVLLTTNHNSHFRFLHTFQLDSISCASCCTCAVIKGGKIDEPHGVFAAPISPLSVHIELRFPSRTARHTNPCGSVLLNFCSRKKPNRRSQSRCSGELCFRLNCTNEMLSCRSASRYSEYIYCFFRRAELQYSFCLIINNTFNSSLR